jgi:hypothetical protein
MTSIDILFAFPRAFKITDGAITLHGYKVWFDKSDASNPGWVVTLADGVHFPVDTIDDIAQVVGECRAQVS